VTGSTLAVLAALATWLSVRPDARPARLHRLAEVRTDPTPAGALPSPGEEPRAARALPPKGGARGRPSVLARLGRPVRRLLGGRPDHALDRRAGAVLASIAAAVLVGPVPALAAVASAVLVGRWRRLRAARAATGATDVARDLPDLVDLLALAVGAGLSVPAAIPTVAPLGPERLRADLRAAAAALSSGRSSDEVVVDLGRRWGDPARPLVHALVDHLRYGTPALPALERVGAEARAARRRAAEARARRLPVVLLFPLVLCTLPAFGVLTVAPLVAGTFDSLRGGPLEAPASVAP